METWQRKAFADIGIDYPGDIRNLFVRFNKKALNFLKENSTLNSNSD